MNKKIIIDGFETHFSVNEDGIVINTLTNKILKGTIKDGYRYYDLRFNGVKKSKSGHRLVAEHFLDNPYNYPIVHHKNGNRLDNRLDNLEWVSYSVNNLQINKSEPQPHNIVITNGSYWYNFRDSVYAVSDTGQIRNNKTNKILKGKITTSGYWEYCLTLNHKKISCLGHRIAYEAFHPGESLFTINHIDGNKLNNSITNLENITQRDNNIKSIYETKSKRFKRVGQYDAENNLIKVFTTCAEAARAMNCSSQSINAAIHNNYCSCGYYWKYIEE